MGKIKVRKKIGYIKYSGSVIQQNFGEDSEKGFLLWDIRSKDDFDVEFHEVKNSYPFVTIDWQGTVKKTVQKCQEYPNLSKFRIRADNYISQADTRQIQKILQKSKLASQVVFKIETKFETDAIQTDSIQNELDLRDPDKIMELMKDYYKKSLDKDDETNLKKLVNKSLSEISHNDDDLRNVKWTINKIKFDNTFSYGEDNVINFDNLPGITGIFGQNARGKSSIIGTIAYNLFNASDRGSIKNIHLVNTRKNSCKSEIDIKVNNVPYRVIRSTTKRQTKKGVWAPTTLKLFKTDKSGQVIEDLTEEQRRETEKIIRRLIGDSESFMMTSLASQGEMNTFIKEKATARKNILSNFLDLTIFDKMNEYARKESSVLKGRINSYKKLDWDKEINLKTSLMLSIEKDISSLDQNLVTLRDSLEDYVKELHSSSSSEYIPEYKVKEIENKIQKNNKNLEKAQANLDRLIDEIYEN